MEIKQGPVNSRAQRKAFLAPDKLTPSKETVSSPQLKTGKRRQLAIDSKSPLQSVSYEPRY